MLFRSLLYNRGQLRGQKYICGYACNICFLIPHVHLTDTFKVNIEVSYYNCSCITSVSVVLIPHVHLTNTFIVTIEMTCCIYKTLVYYCLTNILHHYVYLLT